MHRVSTNPYLMAHDLFTSGELQQIQQAVKQAESTSGGEIVPVLARQSSFYETAFWRTGFLFALLAGALLSALYLFTDYLLLLPPYLWLLIVLIVGLLGALLAQWIPSVKRLFIGKAMQEARVLDQAKDMFYDHGISFTEQRTGVLIYISFFERRAVILADVGINELVPTGAWDTIVDQLTAGIKEGQRTDSISEAILACGQLLEESGVQRAVEDGNELSDEVHLKE